MALADLAIELIYIKELAAFIGCEVDGSIEASTDNKGAFDLCHRFTSASNSRHVDRKLFKMRELRGAGIVTVKWTPTDLNPADMFTKALSRQVFEKHRRVVLNTAGGEAVERLRAAKVKRDGADDDDTTREAKGLADIKAMISASVDLARSFSGA